MKRKALAIVLTLVMLVGVLPMGAFAASYTDTEGHWAEKSIDRWTEAKVLEGMGDNMFAPDDNLTRAQAMTIFSRLLNLTEKGDISKLEDVAADAWYAPYIETGYAYEIIKGTSDTTFDPEGSITREQFFSIFARATGIPGADKLAEGKTFTDLDQISSWAIDEGSVYSMINRGYLNGYPDGSLQPKGNITRAEVAKVLDNAISDYITADGTYAISGDGIVVVLAKDVKLTGSNFNGHIVSSCPDSVLDLSGLTGTPYIYVLGDNTKIINAKPGTTVAVNPAADNVTVNGVKVAYNPYAPVSPYVVPNGGSTIGGGGGGGGGGASKAFNVKLTLDPPFGNNSLELVASNVRTLNAALTGLKYDNDDAAVNVIQHALDRVHFKDTSVNGYVVSVIENGDTVSVLVKHPTEKVDLDASMKDVEKQWTDNMNKAAGQLDDSEQTAWAGITDAFNPYNLFENYSSTQLEDGSYISTMDFLSAQDYADKVSAVLINLNALQQADTNRNFVTELNGILADGKTSAGLDWSNVAYENVALAIQNSSLFAAKDVTKVTITDEVSSVNDAIQQIMGLDVTGDPAIQAMIGAALKESRIQGDYTLTVEVQ